MTKRDLDQMAPEEADAWFQHQELELKTKIFAQAMRYYDRIAADRSEDAEWAHDQLLETCRILKAGREVQLNYHALRSVEGDLRKLAGLKNKFANLEEGRVRHEKAVREARAEGKLTAAVRKEAARERVREMVAANRHRIQENAHTNPNPLSGEPIHETLEEQIINDQLRSLGSIRRIETGHIGWRLAQERHNKLKPVTLRADGKRVR